jgi:hypothetical protein
MSGHSEMKVHQSIFQNITEIKSVASELKHTYSYVFILCPISKMNETLISCVLCGSIKNTSWVPWVDIKMQLRAVYHNLICKKHNFNASRLKHWITFVPEH